MTAIITILIATPTASAACSAKSGAQTAALIERTLHGGGAVDASGKRSLDIVLPVPADGASASTVVAFVQNANTGDVLQALALSEPCARNP